MVRPCPHCATPQAVAACDQLNAALDRLHPADGEDVKRAVIRLLRIVAHGSTEIH